MEFSALLLFIQNRWDETRKLIFPYKQSTLILFVFFSFGCYPERKETPTKGTLEIFSSESVSPLLLAEVDKFQQLYTESSISTQVTFARNAIVALLNDSAQVIISSRPFNKEERDVIKKEQLEIQEHLFAYDAIVFLINKNNALESLRTTQLDSIYSGTINDWNALHPSLPSAKIRLAIPESNSGNLEIITHELLKDKPMKSPDFIAHSSKDMLQYISSTTNAIGFVGQSWTRNISGLDIKVLNIQNPNPPDSLKESAHKAYPPLQYYLWKRYYPFTKPIYIYSRNLGYGVGSGFVTFLMSAHPGEGQKIVGDFGLVPAQMTVRIVQTQKKNITE